MTTKQNNENHNVQEQPTRHNFKPVIIKDYPELRRYKLSFVTIDGMQICKITFPGAMTVMMSLEDPKRPIRDGVAWVGEYAQHLANTRTYEPYTMLTFLPTDHMIKTQIVESNSLRHAREIITRGNYPCFINPNRREIAQLEIMRQRNQELDQYLGALIRRYSTMQYIPRDGIQMKP